MTRILPISGSEPELQLALSQAIKGESARLLRLVHDDIGMPSYGHFRGPSMSQVQDAIEFSRSIIDGRNLFDGPSDAPLIIVHCEHGRSRSAAIALAILADDRGAGDEQEGANERRQVDHPSPAPKRSVTGIPASFSV